MFWIGVSFCILLLLLKDTAWPCGLPRGFFSVDRDTASRTNATERRALA